MTPDDIKRFLGRLWSLGPEEEEGPFRDVVYVLSRRGLYFCAGLAFMTVLVYVLLHWAFGFSLTFTFSRRPERSIVMWEKIVVAAVAIGIILLARTEKGIRHGRTIMMVASLICVAAFVMDDYLGRRSAFSVAYTTVTLIITVVAMPMRPRQTLYLCGWLIVLTYVPQILTRSMPFDPGGLVYFLVLTAMFTVLSYLLYDRSYRHVMAQQLVVEQAVELERALKKSEEQSQHLRELEELKTRFFANITHEFRSPLTLILGPPRDLLRGKYGALPDGVSSALELVVRNGKRLQSLINELLDLARLESGGVKLQVSEVDSAEFLRSLVACYRSLADRSQIVLSFRNEVEQPRLYFDAEKMEKVINNLVSNALKYTDTGGRVRVVLREAADNPNALEIAVKDNGHGIAAQELPYVFDRFRRSGNIPSSEGSSGIGLAMVKELVDLHSGEVYVSSEEGFGSEFVVRLPRGKDHLTSDQILPTEKTALQAEPEALTLPGGPPGSGDGETRSSGSEAEGPHLRKTILIVDDDADLRRYVVATLRPRYNTVEAVNGAEALEKARAKSPDLILSDVVMPVMDGFEFCLEVRRDSLLRHIPLIFLTAKSSDEARLTAMKDGADDIISKPFDAEILVARIENLIELRSLLRAGPSIPFVPEPTEVEVESPETIFLNRIGEIVEAHMCDTNFGVDWFADEMGMSRRHLERRMKKVAGLSPAGYIRIMRLKRAAQLLEKGFGNVSETAFEVGFRDPDHFSRLFRQMYGVNPSQYISAARRVH